MKIAKTRDVKTPIRSTNHSAGIDFFIPTFDNQFVEDFRSMNEGRTVYLAEGIITIAPFETVIIPTGIKVEITPNLVLIAFNKSGIATKRGLSLMAKVVDADYQGEVFVSLHNSTSKPKIVTEGEKITQFILIPYSPQKIREVPIEEIHKIKTKRGDGKLGSTGTH